MKCAGFDKGCVCATCQVRYIGRYASSETYAWAPGQHAALAAEAADLIDEAERVLRDES